jgi:hypothetical protein
MGGLLPLGALRDGHLRGWELRADLPRPGGPDDWFVFTCGIELTGSIVVTTQLLVA